MLIQQHQDQFFKLCINMAKRLKDLEIYISKAGIQDTGMTKVKSQLQTLTAESEAPIILNVDTKTEDRNLGCKGGNSTSDNSVF